MGEQRINKEALLLAVSEDTKVPYDTTKLVVNSTLRKIQEMVFVGDRVSLKGFGTFYKQYHKGHPVQFGKNGEEVKAYAVFKFSASHLLNQTIREFDGDLERYKECLNSASVKKFVKEMPKSSSTKRSKKKALR